MRPGQAGQRRSAQRRRSVLLPEPAGVRARSKFVQQHHLRAGNYTLQHRRSFGGRIPGLDVQLEPATGQHAGRQRLALLRDRHRLRQRAQLVLVRYAVPKQSGIVLNGRCRRPRSLQLRLHAVHSSWSGTKRCAPSIVLSFSPTKAFHAEPRKFFVPLFHAQALRSAVSVFIHAGAGQYCYSSQQNCEVVSVVVVLRH